MSIEAKRDKTINIDKGELIKKCSDTLQGILEDEVASAETKAWMSEYIGDIIDHAEAIVEGRALLVFNKEGNGNHGTFFIIKNMEKDFDWFFHKTLKRGKVSARGRVELIIPHTLEEGYLGCFLHRNGLFDFWLIESEFCTKGWIWMNCNKDTSKDYKAPWRKDIKTGLPFVD